MSKLKSKRNSAFNLKIELLPIFIGRLIPVLSLLIITILFSNKLSYAEYGQFQTMWIIINVLNVILSFGLPSLILSTPINSLIFFYNQNKKKVHRNVFVITTTCLFVFYFVATDFTSITKLLLIVFVLSQVVNTIFDTLLIKNGQVISFLAINSSYSILFFLIHLYFYFGEYIIIELLISMIILSFFKCSSIIFLNFDYPIKRTQVHSKRFFKHWAFIFFNEIIGVFGKWIDKIFLLFLISSSEFAIFYNGSFEIPFLGMMIGSVGTIMLTQISRNIANRNFAKEIFRESFKVLSLISFPLFYYFIISFNEIFYFLFENKYDSSMPVFIIYILLIPIRINHYGVILQCYGKTNIILYGTIIDIITALLFMLLLYPLFGTLGVAGAIVISTYIQVIYYLFHSAKTLNTSIRAIIPVKYLTWISMTLLLIFTFLFISKKFIPQDYFLILSSITTTLIILISVFKQLRSYSKNLSL